MEEKGEEKRKEEMSGGGGCECMSDVRIVEAFRLINIVLIIASFTS